LRKRKLTVTARGRGAAAQPKEATFWLPTYAAMGEGWSVDRWRERNHAERTLSLLPPPDITIVPDGPVSDGSVVDAGEDALGYARQEAAS
jgi:hypothetical protein